MERGPRYAAYSRLRDSRLRLNSMIQEHPPHPESPELEIPKSGFSPSPIKKSVKFQLQGSEFPGQNRTFLKSSSKISSSVVAPTLLPEMRKENRRPPPGNRIQKSATPPPPTSKGSKLYGSQSVNSGGRLVGARKSYASIEELKGLSAATSLSIAGEHKAGRGDVRKTSVLGIRQSVQFY